MWKSSLLERSLYAFNPVRPTTNVVPGELYCLCVGGVSSNKRPLWEAVSKLIVSCSEWLRVVFSRRRGWPAPREAHKAPPECDWPCAVFPEYG